MAGKLKIKNREGGFLIGVIGDEDTVTGFLLPGVGQVDSKRNKNYFVVSSKTPITEIENAFRAMTTRDDLAVILITQHIAEEIRHLIKDYDKLIPTILEIPSKDHPYDKEKDTVMQKVLRMRGTQ
ncbi:vacuolar H+ ATPase F subunit [Planoprotostelium fungivorum]|uniref:V-type proton ATPase subunit F n=1 Tax=Planoprotostelium fungivorum TaxID=1890364 RepID=A0A2P6NC82_9EUKA|nr:vacuolar H+ ATPase F subunit [Planoprotostelium fungivorum]